MSLLEAHTILPLASRVRENRNIPEVQQPAVEQARIEAQKQIAGLQAGVKAAKDRTDLQGRMQLEGLRLGAQIAKDRRDSATKAKPQPTSKPKEK